MESLATQIQTVLVALSEASLDGMVAISPMGEILSYNRRFVDLWHLPAQDLEGWPGDVVVRHMLAQLAAHDQEQGPAALLDATAGQDGSALLRLNDGRVLARSCAPLRATGEALQAHIWCFRDVTEQLRTQEELAGRERFFRALIEQSSDMVALIDPQGTLRYTSPSNERGLGYQPADVLGRNIFEFIRPQDRKQARNVLSRLLERPDEPAYITYRVLHQDGRERLIEGVARNLLAEPGVEALVLNYRDVTERKALEERLLLAAFHDSLTGLPNRNLFMDRLERLVERGKRRPGLLFAVLFVDLDRFKQVNDSLGHLVGDQLLYAAARRLELGVRPSDTVARLGGDEFAILLDEINGLHNAIAIAERLQRDLSAPFQLGRHEVFTTASIGIALNSAEPAEADELLRHADIAMYRAKGRGKACYEIFDAQMQVWAVERMQLERDLRRAVENEEFLLHYQPIVSLADGVVTGFEALVRWQHPRRGMVRPDAFLPIAEETGMIVPIGTWVMREACSQLARWHADYPRLSRLTMSINLSSRQLAQAGLLTELDAILAETGIPPDCLKLEITETVIIENAEAAIAVLSQLHSRGIQIYMDDFGTGYSSLSYIHRLPLDVVKIDRSFVSGVGAETKNTEIIRTILALTQILGMGMIAEGIETEDQKAQLRDLGCLYGQGYLFSRPLERAAAERMLQAV